MISIQKILGDLPDLQLDEGDANDLISSLSSVGFPIPKTLIFFKEKKHLKKFISRIDLLGGEKIWGLFSPKAYELLKEEFHKEMGDKLKGVIKTENFDKAMIHLSKVIYDEKYGAINHFVDGRQMGSANIHPTAQIAQGVFIGEGVEIGAETIVHPGVTIMGKSKIRAQSQLFPGVIIYPFVELGERTWLHANTVIGGDGFGFIFKDGKHQKIYQSGGVIIEDDVEIGANSCVDGGSFGPTIIGAGSKFDNHVQIGHNCQIGKGVIICGHVAIGGSSEIGDYTVFGGKSGMGHDMSLGKQCQVGGGALVNSDWPDGSILGGHPARPLKEWMKTLAYVRNKALK
jgi:UDP-3-O-[3-hydroxymyristoyl] glucosamine N-acyltransferase